MRSSSGQHFVGLDHVRALAAFLVFQWHFIHGQRGTPIGFDVDVSPLLFPLSLIDEGHVGVSLFMTLSGYLFTKLLDGKSIYFGHFLFNRAIRLFPLLLTCLAVDYFLIQHHYSRDALSFLTYIAQGLLLPIYANGGWSVTVELHYYLLIPVIGALYARHVGLVFLLLAAAIALRIILYGHDGGVQYYAYWTLIGRVDQFLLGGIAYHVRARISGKRMFYTVLIAFGLFYWWFAGQGGYYAFEGFPSRSLLWIILPTIEGAACAVLITGYDAMGHTGAHPVSRFIAKMGDYSFSIYLIHFFFIFELARFVNRALFPMRDIYTAMGVGTLCFFLMMPIGFLSLKFIEGPILKRKLNYIRDPEHLL
jgi:peptidoglycan/LPS O-acetylase OafA/YrhL